MGTVIFSEREPEERPLQSRIAAVFVLAGLVLALGAALFNIWALRVQELPPINSREPTAWTPTHLRVVSVTLFDLWLLVMAFLVGSYVMVKIGRAMLMPQPSAKPTQYVDAWGGYRISDEQIASATAEFDPPREPPPDAPPEPRGPTNR